MRLKELEDKLLLVDCDGVLTDWDSSFQDFMIERGYRLKAWNEYYPHKCFGIDEELAESLIIEHNTSERIRNLKPLADAVDVVKQLHQEGWLLGVITSIGDDPRTREMRAENLNNLFGNVFEFIYCISHKECKSDYLKDYSDTGLFWLEDLPENAIKGKNLGLSPILFDSRCNGEFENTDHEIQRVCLPDPWKQTYDIIHNQRNNK